MIDTYYLDIIIVSFTQSQLINLICYLSYILFIQLKTQMLIVQEMLLTEQLVNRWLIL